jgi:hypothetical protein
MGESHTTDLLNLLEENIFIVSGGRYNNIKLNWIDNTDMINMNDKKSNDST